MKIKRVMQLTMAVLLLAVANLSAQQSNANSDMVSELKAKAEQGDASAQCSLGLIYCNGDGVAKDYSEALKWLHKAVDQGDAKAEYNLGVCYERGEGVDKDLAEAVPKDQTEAAKWFRAAVEQDHAAAKFNLGVCYLYGEGVQKDEVEAYKWISLSAAQGHADANKALPAVESQLTAGQVADGRNRAAAYKPNKPLEEGGFDSQ